MTDFPIWGFKLKKGGGITDQKKLLKTVPQTHRETMLWKRISFYLCPSQLWFPKTVRPFFSLKVSSPRPREENVCYFHKNKHITISLFLNLCSSISISVYKSLRYKSKVEITDMISTLPTDYQFKIPTQVLIKNTRDSLTQVTGIQGQKNRRGNFFHPHT